jgi:large subunit ribosomal protein L2
MRKLKTILAKHSGRGASGKISVRHQGGRHKRFLRLVDFARDKRNTKGRVEAIEYDPNRTANLALVVYLDGQRRYVLAPEGLAVGDQIEAGEMAALKPGNALPLELIPVGTNIHNIEIKSGKGGQIIRSAGSFAVIQGREEDGVVVKLPSGELRKFIRGTYATIGQVARVPRPNRRKAGTTRRMGIRPRVRGVAMHPAAHPHGGGEGRSGEGMPMPKTPWGKAARGVKTRRKRKYSDRFIVKRRTEGYGAKASR